MKEPFYLTHLVIHLLRYLIIAGSAFLIFYILFSKKFGRNKIQEKVAKRKDFLRELFHSLQTVAIIALVGIGIVSSGLRDYTLFYDSLSNYPIWWIPLSVFLALVLHDTYFYWMHRTIHQPKLFKSIHYVHHKSTNPSPWASYSFGIFEGFLEAMIAPIIMFTIPMHPISLITFTTVAFGINVYGHLGFEIAPKWFRRSFLFELMNTSVHHNLHHEKFRGNYGLYFRIWDRIMHTENPNYVKEYDKIQTNRFGAKENMVEDKNIKQALFSNS